MDPQGRIDSTSQQRTKKKNNSFLRHHSLIENFLGIRFLDLSTVFFLKILSSVSLFSIWDYVRIVLGMIENQTAA